MRLGRRAGCSPIWAELPFKGFPTSEVKPAPAKGKAFQGCSNRFERLKRYLAVSSRTQTSAFGRMRELPSKAVRENTDRQTSSSGCKIRVKWKTEKGFLPVPTYATLCQRLPVAKNMVQVCKQILYFACAFIRTTSHQQVFVNEYRQFYMNIFS